MCVCVHVCARARTPQVTRYCDSELRGTLKEVHSSTVDKVFSYYPNTNREKAHENTRRALGSMS